ncbi:MAG: 16S rRNA (adenine(1518)-N(6)/adenine(1519)-N(6))-dimethyltransferase RsmA [Acidobacteriaceae bacterium]|jgi:16S rRNA (adenine1518-N6/adenine1519-N6)-dimethyltransferase|nr:16S rRNA (adenine(1518)-N(6)/adenine(1519)-N(6))-dimethyltransferase RsmA [Acidobacteriaceae bacterium]
MKTTRATSRPHPPARKRFGQHFLERSWVEKLVNKIDPRETDTFIEIGPGRGAITFPLAARAGRVVACEIDRVLAASLDARQLPNVSLVVGDFLEITPEQLRAAAADATCLRVAGNLPYNVASPILFKLTALYRAGLPLVDATVMLQREVADRLLASPGTRDYGVLTVLIGYAARIERVLQLPPGAFRPPPKVHSSVVRLVFREPATVAKSPECLALLTHSVFARRRKTLANALLGYPHARPDDLAEWLRGHGIDPARRPETLAIDELVILANDLAALAV